MKNTVTLMLVALVFVGGYSISSLIHAQNTTTTYAPVVNSTDAMLTSVTGIIIAIGSIIAMLSRTGILDKRIGSTAVMASDAAVAIRDNRQTIKDLAQNTYDTVRISSPEVAEAADKKLAPVLDQASVKIDEYTDKVEKFQKIGSILSKSGSKTTDNIKEDEELKDNIPDKIVST